MQIVRTYFLSRVKKLSLQHICRTKPTSYIMLIALLPILLKKASIQKLVTGSEIVDNGNAPTPPNPDGGGDGGDEEAPDPTV